MTQTEALEMLCRAVEAAAIHLSATEPDPVSIARQLEANARLVLLELAERVEVSR